MTQQPFSSPSSCSIKVSTLVKKINIIIANHENASIIMDFHKYMNEKGTSENHQVNNLKVVIDFAKYIGPVSFCDVNKKEQVTSFLNSKIKTAEADPDRRHITTWNHYLNRTKLFARWLYNYYIPRRQSREESQEWETPDFCKIKPKQTKRISPYSESEIWERNEFLTLVKYEPHSRNKAILSLLWDLNARPHEITLLRIKNLRFKDKYAEGEIPYEAKTGTCPSPFSSSYIQSTDNNKPNFNFNSGGSINNICNVPSLNQQYQTEDPGIPEN